MKLRRETGFFNLKSDDEGNFKPILTGLGAEDLIGEIVDITYNNGNSRLIASVGAAVPYPDGHVGFSLCNDDEGTPKYFDYDSATGEVIKMGDVPESGD